MIHHELGRAFVAGADGPEAVELLTPRDALAAAESGLAAGDEVGSARIEAVRALHVWVLEAGPHPRAVAERLVAVSAEYALDCVRGLPAADRAAATEQNAAARERALMRVLLDAPRARARQVRRHGEQIAGVLGKAHRREVGMGQDAAQAAQPSDISRLQIADDSEGAAGCAVRREACRRWLMQVWAARSLGDALKAFYALTRGFWPELVMNLTGEELATFFAQTRAAESERMHRVVNRPIERASGRRATLRFQKSATACAKYAAGAMGNTHRADSCSRAAA